MRLRCDYCGKDSKRIIKCRECKKFVCPVCIVNTRAGGFCPSHSILRDQLMIHEYFEEKYSEKTLHAPG